MKKPVIYKKRGNVWYYRRSGELTFHSTACTTKTGAENYVKDHVDQFRDASTFEDFARDFFREGSSWVKRRPAQGHSIGEAQAQNRQNHLDRYILAQFGTRKLGDITKPEIEDWLLTLPLSNATRNHMLYTLRIIFREAEARGKITKNPLQPSFRRSGYGFLPPPRTSRSVQFLTEPTHRDPQKLQDLPL